MTATTALLAKGDVLAGYRIDDLIGIGGMAIVYRAEQVALGRPVALKVLAPQLSQDETFKERFRHEGRHVAALDHPNVVTIYDSGEAESRLYLAMRLVEGTTLAERMQTGGLTLDQTLAILCPIADALDAAHAIGLVHRDVKPQNILVAAHDHPYLADFGVAKASASTSGLTRTGDFVGSINYASPEQIEGGSATAAGDVYALTAVLYQCLTGEVPYPLDTDAGIMHAHLHSPPPSLSGVGPGVQELAEVITRGMAKSPAERFDHAGQLLAAATQAIAGLPESDHEVPSPFAPGRSLPDSGLSPAPSLGEADDTSLRLPPSWTPSGQRHQSPTDAVDSHPDAAGIPDKDNGQRLPADPGPGATPKPVMESRAVRDTTDIVGAEEREALRSLADRTRADRRRGPAPEPPAPGPVADDAPGMDRALQAALASTPSQDPPTAAVDPAMTAGPRVGSDVQGARRPRRRRWWVLALVAGVGAATLAGVLTILSSGAASAPRLDRISAAGLDLAYRAPWRLVAGPGEPAIPTGLSRPVVLRSGRVTLELGQLQRSAAVPGGVPPELVARLGSASERATTLGRTAASQYTWRTGATAVVAVVVPGADHDRAVVCSAPATPADSLRECLTLAGMARAVGFQILRPGVDRPVQGKLELALKPASRERPASSLRQTRLSERALPAQKVSSAYASSATQLLRLTLPVRFQVGVDHLSRTLHRDAQAFGRLAGAARAAKRSAYVAARAAAIAAGKAVLGAARGLAADGFRLPALIALDIAGLPPVPRPKVHAATPSHSAGTAATSAPTYAAPSPPTYSTPSAPPSYSPAPSSAPKSSGSSGSSGSNTSGIHGGKTTF